ncbi:MAG: M48 family metallopeptidase [Leptospiraceae bacterium]|nr:M48 family metallopeptidase [Leptospiraceae bacterium]
MKKSKIYSAFLILYIIKISLSLALKSFNYQGDSSPEIEDLILQFFSPEDIEKGRAYHRDGFFVSLISFAIHTFIFLSLIFTSLGSKLENFFLKLTNGSNPKAVFLFFSSIYSLIFLLNLPFSFYFGYILEHRHGFSNMDISFFFLTQFKTFLISCITISLVTSSISFLVEKFPVRWNLILPFAGTVFIFISVLLYPYLILPVYYDVQAPEDPGLKLRISQLLEKEGIVTDQVYVIRESAYSGHTNAFFTGFGKEKKIYLYDTLLEKNTEREILSILGHEAGHWKGNHSLYSILMSFFVLGIGSLLLKLLLEKCKENSIFHIRNFAYPTSILFSFFLYSLFSFYFSPLESYLSRQMEIYADREALRMTNDPDAFVSAEIKLARDNKSRLDPHRFVVFFYHSHPTALDRIRMAIEYKESNQTINP